MAIVKDWIEDWKKWWISRIVAGGIGREMNSDSPQLGLKLDF